jgi:hypothetical protein
VPCDRTSAELRIPPAVSRWKDPARPALLCSKSKPAFFPLRAPTAKPDEETRVKKKKKPLGAARICSERFAFPRFPILLPCSKIFFPFCLSFPLRALRFFGVLPSLLHPIDSLSLSLFLPPKYYYLPLLALPLPPTRKNTCSGQPWGEGWCEVSAPCCYILR